MTQEFPDVQVGFRKDRGTRGQVGSIHQIREKAREFQKKTTSTSVSLTTLKPLTEWITKSQKILTEMEIPGQLTCLLRNLYAGQETAVRIRHRIKCYAQVAKSPIDHQGADI